MQEEACTIIARRLLAKFTLNFCFRGDMLSYNVLYSDDAFFARLARFLSLFRNRYLSLSFADKFWRVIPKSCAARVSLPPEIFSASLINSTSFSRSHPAHELTKLTAFPLLRIAVLLSSALTATPSWISTIMFEFTIASCFLDRVSASKSKYALENQLTSYLSFRIIQEDTLQNANKFASMVQGNMQQLRILLVASFSCIALQPLYDWFPCVKQILLSSL